MDNFKEMFKMAFGIGCGVIAAFFAFAAAVSLLNLLVGLL